MAEGYGGRPKYWQPTKAEWQIIQDPVTPGCWAVAPINRPCFVIAVDSKGREAYVQMLETHDIVTVPLDVLNRIEWEKPVKNP